MKMKNANEAAKITAVAINKQARDFIANKVAPAIINRAEESKGNIAINLLKNSLDYETACRIGPKIKAILENEFDYIVDFTNYSSYQEEDAYLIYLLFFEEVTVKEVAQICGCSRKTIQNRRKKILNKLCYMIKE